MKKHQFLLLIFISVLFYNGSCECQEGQRFIIQNNSNNEIIIFANRSISIKSDSTCLKSILLNEMRNRFRVIPPHFYKNFERSKWGEGIINHPIDTFYVGIFYLTDIDTMSCEEFKQAFPLKKEWKVTLADMEACDWTLVYTPEE